MDLISGIITTHNRSADIVERALKGILNQTYKKIEVIVVDDSNNDYPDRDLVKATVESYSNSNVRYIRHKECLGACAARNTGLSDANGEIVGFLDDDDEWLPEKVERMLPSFSNPDVAIVYSDCQMFSDDDGSVVVKKMGPFSGYVFDELITGDNFIGSTSFPLLRKQFVLEVGGFDMLMQSAQDLDLWLRISQRYRVKYLDETLNRYHYYSGERITNNFSKRVNGNKRLIDKNIDYLKINKSAYYSRCNKLMLCYVNNFQFKEALLTCFKCFILCPRKVPDNIKNIFMIIRGIVKLKDKNQ